MTPAQLDEVWSMVDRGYLAEVAQRGPTPVFATISGAHLYGFASRDSDVDLRGAYLLSAEEMLGLARAEETLTIDDQRVMDLDWVAHDLRKFARMMVSHNGYVLEQLFSPLVVVATPAFEELRELGRGCVTRPLVRHYLGFANGRRKRLREPDPTVKHLLYAYRVLLSGIHVMRSGEIVANLAVLNGLFARPQIDALVRRKQEGAEKMPLDASELAEHERALDALEAELHAAHAESTLPDEPTTARAIEALVVRERLATVGAGYPRLPTVGTVRPLESAPRSGAMTKVTNPVPIFVTLAGSHAHGTAHDGSDVDLRGVCIAPLAMRLSLFRTFEQSEEPLEGALQDAVIERVRAHPSAARGLDVKLESVMYDVAKFVRLCAAANPNALEMLFSDERDWLFATPAWRALYAQRQHFLTKRVKQTYLGYALAQLAKIERHRATRDDPEARARRNPARAELERLHGYDTKHAMHLLRMMETVLEVLETATLSVRRPDARALAAVRDGALSYEALHERARDLQAGIERAAQTTALPDDVDCAFVDALALELICGAE